MDIDLKHRYVAKRRKYIGHKERCSSGFPGKPLLTRWAESFIFAGSSALLLLIASHFLQYWYFTFFSLTPFLYRIVKNVPGESLRLGFLLGLTFFGASLWHSIMINPLVYVPKLLGGMTLFSLFGWVVGWIRRCWGFNPFVLAALWVGLEMGLLKFGFAGGIFGRSEIYNPFLHGLFGLLGFLAVSALIVVLNSLLILAVLKALEMVRTSGKAAGKKENQRGVISACSPLTEKVYLVPENRAPPFFVRFGQQH